MIRVGLGYDIHPLIEGRPLKVGGVVVLSPRGALGHSDGDVLLHALTDSLLGAAGLGDIGQHFPDTDPRWRNADSALFVEQSMELVAKEGWSVENVDVNLLMESPKVGPYFPEMKKRIAQLLRIRPNQINLKAKRGEGLDAVGEGRAIAAQVACLLKSTTP